MASFNKVILAGNLTRDPQLSYLPSNTPVVEFGLAMNRKWKAQNGEMREEVCFVDIRAYGRQAETLNQYMNKGKPLLVEGHLRYDTWEGKDGQKRSKLYVVVDNFQFIGAPSGEGNRGPRPPARPAAPARAGAATGAAGGYDEMPPIEDAPEGGGEDIPF
ncbi:MAG: single-stranded DNA-binding protein [Planctomycetota bacterium]|nr:MAG: single-stranded DNA-binding protein [Planctomycetota bacterium]